MKRKVFTCFVVLVALFAMTGVTQHVAYASTPTAAVWIGSPVDGTWPDTQGCYSYTRWPSRDCSLPKYHHTDYYSYYPYPVGVQRSDWAMDLQHVYTNQPVILYAAPQVGGTNISAQVQTVDYACADRVASDGGYHVTVAFYDNVGIIGTVTFAHIQPAVSQGQWISRWGTLIGTVGSYTSNECWKGVHLHVEMSSYHNYACYNKGFHPVDWWDTHSPDLVYKTNFIGFIGGNYASHTQAACP